MTTGLQQSELYHLAVKGISNYKLIPKQTCKKLFLYVTSGTVHLQLMHVDYTIETGNLLLIENLNVSSIALFNDIDFGLVVVEIF